MAQKLKLMAALAHPDDESLGFGGTLAKCAAEGVDTHLVTATRGERGRFGSQGKTAEPAEVGRVREAELRVAAAKLGIRNVSILGYPDGAVDQMDAATAIRAVAWHIRRIRPHVVVTFGPDGIYGHPDHIAISQYATAAIVEAASPLSPYAQHLAPHRVAKLYYMAPSNDLLEGYQLVFGNLAMDIDGQDRRAAAWPDWQITTRIDASDHWRTVWKAVRCHQTQIPASHHLAHVTEKQHKILWSFPTYYRSFSLVNGGRSIENDVFAGLRV